MSPAIENTSKTPSSAKRKAPLVIAVIALVALVYVLASVGHFQPFPFPAGATVVSGDAEGFSAQAGAVVDHSGERLLILDGNKQIVSAISTSQTDEEPIYYDEVEVQDSNIYVTEYSYIDNSDYLSFVRIAKYDAQGNRLGTVAQLDFDLGDHRTMTTVFLDFAIVGDEGIAVVSGSDGDHVGLLHFPLSGETAGEEAVEDLGSLAMGTNALAAKYYPETETVVCIDLFGYLYEKTAEDSSFNIVDPDADDLDETVASLVEQLETAGFADVTSEGETFGYVPGVLAFAVLYWLCVVFLALLAIALVVYAARKTLKARNFHALKIAGACVLAFVAALGIVSYYSYNLVTNEQDHAKELLVGYSSTLASALDEELADAVAAYSEGDEYDGVEVLTQTAKMLEEETCKTALAGTGLDFTLLTSGPEGEAVVVADSAFYVEVGSVLSMDSETPVEFDSLLGENSVQAVRNPYTNSLFATTPVTDAQGNVVGALAASMENTPYNASTYERSIAMFLTLVDALIVIAFILSECTSFARSFQMRSASRRRKQRLDSVAKAAARPLVFLAIGSHACVTTLLTLVSQDTLAGTALAGNELAIAIPPMAASVGLIVGVSLQALLAERVQPRRLLIACASLLVVSFVAGGVGVMAGSFVVLTASVFAGSVFDEMIVTYAFKLPLSLANDADRSALNRSLSAGVLSSVALAGIFIGALTQYYGNQYAFFLGAIYALAILPVVIAFIPKGYGVVAGKGEAKAGLGAKAKPGLTAFKKFLTDPHILVMIVCIVIPIAIVGGYKSYLFPLLADNVGMTKSSIASIIVYCNAFAYFTSPAMAKVETAAGPRMLLVGGCSLLAVVFMVFSVNVTMTWLIAALVLVTLAIKVIEPGYASFWQNRIIKTGASKDAAYTSVKYLERAGEILRAPALGTLATMCGIALACPIVGIVLAVCTVAFALVSASGKAA